MYEISYFKPDESISWLVKQFESISIMDKSFFEDKFIPRTDTALVFHFKSLPYLTDPVHVQLQPFFVAPLVRKANKLKSNGELDTFIITCRPSILSRFFNIDMTPNPGLGIKLNRKIFLPLWRNLKECRTIEKRMEYFTGYVRHFSNEQYRQDYIDRIVDKIIEKSFRVTLSDILREFDVSKSTIQRNFLKRIGVSPKTLARIARVNYIWNILQSDNQLGYQDLVYLGKYFDQSHFIKDFKALTGETPNKFFKRDLNVCKMLSGRE